MLATIARLALPGLAVAVAVDGKTVWDEGFGYADVERKIAASPATRFRIGSLSKLITAATVAQLAAKRVLDLDAPVSRYVPRYPAKAHPITLRQLAGHTAGVRHYAPKDFMGGLSGGPGALRGLDVFIDDPLLFEPGTKYAYSSYGYYLLGAAVEGATGRPFEDAARIQVLDPLRLRDTVPEREGADPGRAAFYARGQGGMLVVLAASAPGARLPAGGFLSTARDLARFGSAHLHPGHFDRATLGLFFTPVRLRSGESTGVGFGWRIAEEGIRRIYHHGGAMDGCRAFLLIDPTARVVVALVANLQADFGEPEARALATSFASV